MTYNPHDSYYRLSDGANSVELPMLNVEIISVPLASTVERPTSGYAFRVIGDEIAKPVKVTVSIDGVGLDKEREVESVLDKRDMLVETLANAKFLIFNDRKLWLNPPYTHSEKKDSKNLFSLLKYSYYVYLPYWLSINMESVVKNVAAGGDTVGFVNNGYGRTFPILELTGVGLNDVTIEMNGRLLQWIDSVGLGAGGSLIINMLTGEVIANGVDALANVIDNSLFPYANAGANTVSITGNVDTVATLNYYHTWRI